MRTSKTQPVSSSHKATGFWAGLAMLLTAVIYFRLWAGRVLAGGDLHTYFFPYWMAVIRALQQGTLPLWNPNLFAGAPLLANSQVGVYYPLNWLCWLGSLLAGGSLLSVTRALHFSVLLHLELSALTAFILARKLRLSAPAAAIVALLYAGNGFLGVHVEHLNQLQALAWFPLLLIPFTRMLPQARTAGSQSLPPSAVPLTPGKRDSNMSERAMNSSGSAEFPLQHTHQYRTVEPVVVLSMSMILLAGHTQMAFIALVMLASATVICLIINAQWKQPRAWFQAILYWLPLALAALIAMAQLVPTFELTGLSARSGGLNWRDAVAFSLRPIDALLAWLPTYIRTPQLPESVIAFSLLGLGMAVVGGLRIRREQDELGWLIVSLAILGVALALGGYNPLYLLLVRIGLPGLSHFRAPARFLSISVLCVSLLAGHGLDSIVARLSERKPATESLTEREIIVSRVLFTKAGMAFYLLGYITLELILSGSRLPHADATIVRAYTDLRPATAHLVATAEDMRDQLNYASRFLSVTQTLFEVGDKAEIESAYANTLPSDALMAYLVSTKQREVLVPNLPLAFNVPAADGYDGGLLPTRYFQQFSKVLLPDGTLDGRLRENLDGIPETRWLDLLNVSLAITDKTADTWINDVFYDRQFQQTLDVGQSLRIGWLPETFTATGIRVLAEGPGAVVARLRYGGGTSYEEVMLHPMEDQQDVLFAPLPAHVYTSLVFHAPDDQVLLSGVTLVDERSGAFYPLVLSSDFRLAHSGDVKIYQRLEPAPRAWFVGECQVFDEDEQVLTAMQDPDFDPMQQVVIAESVCQNSTALDSSNDITMTHFGSNQVDIVVDLQAPRYLVLADAWYPGWKAHYIHDGIESGQRPLTVERANLFQRAVYLPEGRWKVTFVYAPTSFWVGLLLSGVGIFGYALYIIRWKIAKHTQNSSKIY